MEDSRNIIKAIDALTLKAGGEVVDSKNITEAIDQLKAVYDQKAIGIDKTLTQSGLAADAKAVGSRINEIDSINNVNTYCSDLNNANTSWCCYDNTTQNTPPYKYGVCHTFGRNGNGVYVKWRFQVAFSSKPGAEIYTRYSANEGASWSEWTTIAVGDKAGTFDHNDYKGFSNGSITIAINPISNRMALVDNSTDPATSYYFTLSRITS